MQNSLLSAYSDVYTTALMKNVKAERTEVQAAKPSSKWLKLFRRG